MPAYYGTDAVILFSREAGEADRVVSLYTKELGRVDAIVKAARSLPSKLRGHLTLFTPLRIMVTPGREYWRLVDAEVTGERVRDGFSVQEECARFIRALVHGAGHDEELWGIISRLGALKTRTDLLATKVALLGALGFLPEDFPAVCDDQQECERGVEKILRANHVVY